MNRAGQFTDTGYWAANALYTVAEYIWIDGSGCTLRSKCRTIAGRVFSLADIPEWNYDGSSCWQADTENSEIIMKPVAYYRDPFRKGHHILVMTEAYRWTSNGYESLEPATANFRAHA